MVEAIKSINFLFDKGGSLYLLSFFFLLNFGRSQEIVYDKNVISATYGQITIKGLNESVVTNLRNKNLTSKQWSTFFKITVESSTRPMLGTYSTKEDKIHFKPRFLPDPEISYETTFSSASLNLIIPDYPIDEDVVSIINFNELGSRPNQVVKVFPESDQLPANILRFYIHFSNPADFQNPFDYIRIENENGDVIAEPFVEMEEGLWSIDRKRLTVLIHPGRIKRNVGPNMTIGEVFEEGESYQLVVSEKWNLKEKFIKPFKITSALRTEIDVENWEVEIPDAGTTDQLIIRTNRLLDNALSERLIEVRDENGAKVNGDFRYKAVDDLLIFKPEYRWVSKDYLIDVNPKLEDVSGNTPQSVFDIEGEGSKEKNKKFELRFSVK